MRMLNRVGITAALLVSMVAAPAAAQNWRWDLGFNGGASWYSDMLGDDVTGSSDDNAKFKAGWLAGSQLTIWVTPRIGIRANGTFSERPLVPSNDPGEDAHYWGDVNLWSGSGDLMFRFRAPNEDWMGSEFLPYLAVGGGRKWINGASDSHTCADDVCNVFFAGSSAFGLAEASKWMGLVGLGADWRMSPRMALRLEVSDRIYKPLVYQGTYSGTTFSVTNDNVSKTVHEVAGQLGLHFLFGLQRPEVVAVTPAPAPPPPPPAAPAPPREDAITVCVIDPTAPNGIRMQNALFLHASGDTVIVADGNRVPLRQAVGQVQVARTADWYVRGEPLTLNVGRYQMQYLTYQGATMIEADRLTYLGTINGYPVYANRDEVADIRADLEELRRAQASNDLADILDERNDIRGELEDIKLLYVPLEPTGCVFQTVQMLEQVRKGKE